MSSEWRTPSRWLCPLLKAGDGELSHGHLHVLPRSVMSGPLFITCAHSTPVKPCPGSLSPEDGWPTSSLIGRYLSKNHTSVCVPFSHWVGEATLSSHISCGFLNFPSQRSVVNLSLSTALCLFISKWTLLSLLGFSILLSARLPWWWLRWLRICPQCGRPGFSPWVRKIPWRGEWRPTPAFLSGESHGQRSLEGCSPLGNRESEPTEPPTQPPFYFSDKIVPGPQHGFQSPAWPLLNPRTHS